MIGPGRLRHITRSRCCAEGRLGQREEQLPTALIKAGELGQQPHDTGLEAGDMASTSAASPAWPREWPSSASPKSAPENEPPGVAGSSGRPRCQRGAGGRGQIGQVGRHPLQDHDRKGITVRLCPSDRRWHETADRGLRRVALEATESGGGEFGLSEHGEPFNRRRCRRRGARLLSTLARRPIRVSPANAHPGSQQAGNPS